MTVLHIQWDGAWRLYCSGPLRKGPDRICPLPGDLGGGANSAIVHLRATSHHSDVRGERRCLDGTVRSLHEHQPPSLGSHISCCFVTMPMLILTWTPTCGLMSQPGLGPWPSPQRCPMPWAVAAAGCPAPWLGAVGWVLAEAALPCLTQGEPLAPESP